MSADRRPDCAIPHDTLAADFAAVSDARAHLARQVEHEAERYLTLRRACRALSGLDAAALDAVTPAAMRRVMERRGWHLDCALAWFADRTRTAFESWEHSTASGAGSRNGSVRMVPDVRVAVLDGIDADERCRYVAEWAWAVATRHGDVSPAEVLAEALTEVTP